MRMKTLSGFRRSLILLAGLAAFSAETPVLGQSPTTVTALVPAYFYPTWWSGSPWDDLTRAASRIPLEAIMNPASGPGTAPNADYERAVADLRMAGGKVIGYVATGYGARPLGAILGEIDAYLAWYAVDGIFVDEMGNQLGSVDYQAIYDYVKGLQAVLGRELRVVGNPGIPFPQVEVFLSAADTLVIFEGPLSTSDPQGASFRAYPTRGPYAGMPLWFLNDPRQRFANLVYAAPSARALGSLLDKAIRFNAGYVYITNDVLPNPWDSLPSYWNLEVDAIAARNAGR